MDADARGGWGVVDEPRLSRQAKKYCLWKQGLPLETKNTQNHENWRLCLIESLHMQHCSLRGYINLFSKGDKTIFDSFLLWKCIDHSGCGNALLAGLACNFQPMQSV